MDTLDVVIGAVIGAIVVFATIFGLGYKIVKVSKFAKPKTGGQMPFDGPSGPRAEE
jgi:hypothetical protein